MIPPIQRKSHFPERCRLAVHDEAARCKLTLCNSSAATKSGSLVALLMHEILG